VLKETDYKDYLENANEEKEQIQARIENIEELGSVAKEFTSLQDYLENVALVEAGSEFEEEDIKKVTLMTLHAAKGLEFDYVFLIGLEEGLFPHNRSVEDREKLEEERRLCYVGITRAKTKLYITYATKRMFFGKTSFNMVSRFVSEIPENLIETSANTKLAGESQKLDNFFENMGL
jgi:DNA helicase-2/ATP-dependent DNA helicase PcrA